MKFKNKLRRYEKYSKDEISIKIQYFLRFFRIL